MIEFYQKSASKQILNSCITCMLCVLISGCQSDMNTDIVNPDHSPPDHHRILTELNGATFHLIVGNGSEEPEIQVLEGELTDAFNDEAAWQFIGETSFKLSSWNLWLGGNSLLSVPDDGSSLNLILANNGLNISAVQWQLVPMPDGGCSIRSELLGSELALSIDTTTEPYTAVMMSVDSMNRSQRWHLNAYGDADATLDERCL